MAQDTVDFFNSRRVTRDQFKEFLKNPQDNSDFCCLLREKVPGHQREALLKTGDSVCRIDIDGKHKGTGFHLGGGWIMTNQHVICYKDADRSSASRASFIFPDRDRTIEAAPRNVIFSYFQHDDDRPVHDSIKDLALVLVEEILNGDRPVPPLIDPFHKSAKEGDRAFLIHRGDGVEDKKNATSAVLGQRK